MKLHLPWIVRKLFPQSLKGRIVLLAMCLVTLTTLIIGYVVETRGYDALLEEKENKLQGIAVLMDQTLGDDFDTLLDQPEIRNKSREEKIRYLSQALKARADFIARAYPGVGLGYYHKKLDAIVAYAPSDKYAGYVGVTIKPDHPGRIVMQTGKFMADSGMLVRGNIRNVMVPIWRNNEVVGYIWANEFLDDIRNQIQHMDFSIFVALGIGLLASFFLITFVINHFARDVDRIKTSLHRLRFDLCTPLPVLKGEAGEIMAAITDMAESLSTSRTFNEHILDSLSEGVITVNVQGEVTTVNPAAQRMLKIDAQNMLGKLFTDEFGAADPLAALILADPARGNIQKEVQYSQQDKLLILDVSSCVLLDAERRVLGRIIIFTDITESCLIQQQISRAERLAALGELMAGIAHEVNNPLTSIRGFVQFLQHKNKDPGLSECLSIILKEADSINDVMRQLLEFARLKPNCYSMVDLAGLIDNVLLLVKMRKATARISFKVDIEADLPGIEADGEQLKQVLLNLLINSVQAIEDQGKISIQVETVPSGYVKIVLQDTGCGIRPQDMPNIFTPFFTTKPEGTGLGLAIVQRIITAHHGLLHIESVEGQGTIIRIALPIFRKEK